MRVHHILTRACMWVAQKIPFNLAPEWRYRADEALLHEIFDMGKPQLRDVLPWAPPRKASTAMSFVQWQGLPCAEQEAAAAKKEGA